MAVTEPSRRSKKSSARTSSSDPANDNSNVATIKNSKGSGEAAVTCTYCGALADTIDQVKGGGRPTRRSPPSCSKKQRQTSVPSCRTCVSALKKCRHEAIASRAAHLLKQYRSRYTKSLQQPDWTEEELEEMGFNMLVSIRAALGVKEDVQELMERLEKVIQVAPTIEDAWIAFDASMERS